MFNGPVHFFFTRRLRSHIRFPYFNIELLKCSAEIFFASFERNVKSCQLVFFRTQWTETDFVSVKYKIPDSTYSYQMTQTEIPSLVMMISVIWYLHQCCTQYHHMVGISVHVIPI